MENFAINNNIRALIEKLGISPYEFSQRIGNKRADNIYNIINNKVEIGPKTLSKILSTFPQYRDLIIGGEDLPNSSISNNVVIQGRNISNNNVVGGTGNKMAPIEKEGLRGEDACTIYEAKGTPYYNVDFTGGFDLSFNEQSIMPDYYVNFEPLNIKNALWCNITGKSMEPEIYSGDKIIIRELKDWREYLPMGEIYGIVTDEHRTIKRIKKSEREGCLKLVPTNKEFDEQDIPINKIVAIFKVLGAVKMF